MDKKYIVKEEYREMWSNSTKEEDYIISYSEIERLAIEWETDINVLMEQVEEF